MPVSAKKKRQTQKSQKKKVKFVLIHNDLILTIGYVLPEGILYTELDSAVSSF